MKKLTSYEVHQLCAALSIALKSGMPLQDALECMKEDTSRQIQDVIQSTQQSLREAKTLHEAWCETKAFPTYALHLCEVGERCGCLDQVMQSLSMYYKRSAQLEDQIHHALFYPFLLLIFMFVVMGILIWKVLPIFQNVLHSLGSELSSFAYQLMHAGSVLAAVGFLILALFLLVILCFYLSQKKGTKEVPNFLSKFPLTKSLYHEMAMAQLTYVLALFIYSGLQVEEALPSLTKATKHPFIKKKLETLQTLMQEEHYSFLQAIRKTSLYKGMEMGMLEIGFENGAQDEVMKELADTYEQRIDSQIAEFLNVLEPAILTILSVFVGMILLSVMLPLMSVIQSL